MITCKSLNITEKGTEYFMKILIIGTGVIGCIYGWQLSESGNKITHFVRKGQKEQIDKARFSIRCLDARKADKPVIEKLYRPDVTEQMNDTYDLIIVPVKANQLESILPIIAQTEKHIDILFLQNLWVNHIRLIESGLPDSRIIYGQAHIMGGGKRDNIITCTIFGNKSAPTMLGKKDGSKTEQVMKIAKLMQQANLNPKVSKNILAWLYTHYTEANGLVVGVMEAGSSVNYISQRKYVRHSVKVIREGFKVCAALKIHAWKIYPQVLYYFPMWILLPALLKMYSTEETQLMIQGHISHSLDEMKEMFCDVLNTGESFHMSMTYYKQMQKIMFI